MQDSALEYALNWSKDKRLSNLDDRFIGASQKLAKQQAEYNLSLEKIT
ncbi:hypothetical protein H1P_3900002 [Hyella patelloides LEGE 07179]|uniref:Uncharacterized protein n=1 Tax=Hyella patelloides LEGE 07179 TaxID=945734 RepID=A0A563VX43_9CYAN|nr:hypothetical protein [Hyella patelloides]VEP15965.1 hypothetical protein H1P_3900002 [Hyella patelloides LEGE 07179]